MVKSSNTSERKLPPPFVDVMITFKDADGNRMTKRGFYSDLFNNFAIPPSYQMFNGRLLPHGFGGHHFPIDSKNIISWEPIQENKK
jgi:hypothetical protein